MPDGERVEGVVGTAWSSLLPCRMRSRKVGEGASVPFAAVGGSEKERDLEGVVASRGCVALSIVLYVRAVGAYSRACLLCRKARLIRRAGHGYAMSPDDYPCALVV
jgi:hypothetical protein